MAWLNSGIDFSLPGNGGPDCVEFHSTPRRIFETSVGVGLCLMSFYVGYSRHTVPTPDKTILNLSSRTMNGLIKLLCLAMAVVYALEVGFKFVTLQVKTRLNEFQDRETGLRFTKLYFQSFLF